MVSHLSSPLCQSLTGTGVFVVHTIHTWRQRCKPLFIEVMPTWCGVFCSSFAGRYEPWKHARPSTEDGVSCPEFSDSKIPCLDMSRCLAEVRNDILEVWTDSELCRWLSPGTTTRLYTLNFTRLYTHFFPRLYTHVNHHLSLHRHHHRRHHHHHRHRHRHHHHHHHHHLIHTITISIIFSIIIIQIFSTAPSSQSASASSFRASSLSS